MTSFKLAAFASVLTLAACSSGSGGGGSASLPDQLRSDTRDSLADYVEIQTLFPTAFDAMPTSGSATFDGKAALTIEQTGDAKDINILGDSTLTARFGAGTITGEVTKMVGTRGNPLRPDSAFNVDGKLTIGENVSIVGNDVDDNLTSLPNDWYADVEGRVSVPGASFNLEGNIFGKFRGTKPGKTGGDAITAIEGSTFDMFAERNGRELGASLDVYGFN